MLIDGTDRIAELLAKGDLDIATIPGPSLVRFNAAGADLVMILSLVGRNIHGVIADRDIIRPRDLMGKPVGISKLGDADHLSLAMAFEEWGIDLQRDVKVMDGMSPSGVR